MNEQLTQFDQQLPDLMYAWSRALRCGYSVLQILEATTQMQTTKRPFSDPNAEYSAVELMEMSSQERLDPIVSEFKQVYTDFQTGTPLLEAMETMLARVPSDNLNLVITTMRVQRQVGGNLADILEILSHVMRQRGK